MKKISYILPIILAIFVIIVAQSDAEADELMRVPAAIHISSTVSDGGLSIPEIVRTARKNNIKIVILTDRDFMRWQYGLWPLRRIIKKTVETSSVSSYGIKRYLKEIEEVQKRNPDLVIIPGVESAPFYYWEGNPFKNNLKMHNWHKHMLVIGLEKVSDYKNLPSVSNGNSLALPFTFKDICRFWPILTLVVGILCLRKRKFNYKDLRSHPLGPYSRRWQVFGIIVIIPSLLFLFNNFPFRDFKYDQYHGEQGIGPYQNLINYINQKGGLTFWAHPEAEYMQRRGMVSIETRKHADNLLEAYGYTGFAIFYEGYKKVGCPGGIWDEVLNQYCQGIQEAPMWAIGGLSFDQAGGLSRRMQDLRTVLLVPHLTKAEVLRALRKGRMYVVRGHQSSSLLLDEFAVYDSLSDNKGVAGDEVNIKGKALLKIRGAFFDEEQQGQVRLIRNGYVIKTFEVMSPFEINYHDDYSDENKKIYYRLEISCPGGSLITNPIFVNPHTSKSRL